VGHLRDILHPVVEKLAVSIFNKHYFDLVEIVIDYNMDDLFMLPVYLIKFAFQHKQK